MNLIRQYEDELGAEAACDALDVSRATYYRWKQESSVSGDSSGDATESERPERQHPRGLRPEENAAVLAALTSERFRDQAPEQVYSTLLDDGKYFCSPRTMYRILARNHAVRERRNQLRHPQYVKPELLATKPNQLWSWDITKLKMPGKWTYLYLYVIIDVFSRKVVAWTVAHYESQKLAKSLILDAILENDVDRGQLTIHADRGAVMKAKTVSQLMADLGVERSHSRPHVSNDNPYSESQFKTLKYHHTFPGVFGSLEDAKSFLAGFFDWYNHQHKHSGIAYLSPDDVHAGRAKDILARRNEILAGAFARHPERFVRKKPMHEVLPNEVWINKPKHDLTDNKVA